MTPGGSASACGGASDGVGRADPDHHPGFIDRETFEANQARIGSNTRPRPRPGGAVREGTRCCRASPLRPVWTGLRVYYSGRHATPGYHCAGGVIVNGRGEYCLRCGRPPESMAPSSTPSSRPSRPRDWTRRWFATAQLEADQDAGGDTAPARHGTGSL